MDDVVLSLSPKQSRSKKTIKALLQAGRHMIELRGIDGLSMSEVVLEAGSSVGSLYFHFGDKNGFVSAILERALGDTRDAVREMVEAASAAHWTPEQILQRWVAMKVDMIEEHRALLRAVLQHTLAQPATWEPIRQFGRFSMQQLMQLLENATPPLTIADWPQRVRIAMQVVNGTLMNLIIVEGAPLSFGDEALKRELADVVELYVWGGRR
jgi:AcrR family transcriptional regulator